MKARRADRKKPAIYTERYIQASAAPSGLVKFLAPRPGADAPGKLLFGPSGLKKKQPTSVLKRERLTRLKKHPPRSGGREGPKGRSDVSRGRKPLSLPTSFSFW